MKKGQNNWPSGVKRTKQRESVLSILEDSQTPLSASDICSKMEKDYDETIWMSTVYRILEVFMSKDLVIKTSVMNSDMALYELNRFHHKHYAVCTSCHKMIAMDHCPMEKFIPKIEDGNFHVLGHNLEIYGICKDCNQSVSK